MDTFIQLGATRDGLDPYLHVAHARGMEAILVETPDYLQWRKVLGRQEFDRTIAVEHPSEVNEVLAALVEHTPRPTMLLAGFERYITTAYVVAKRLGILPYRSGDAFLPLNKAEQRMALTQKQAPVYQPDYVILEDFTQFRPEMLSFSYPYVIKPVDGGGGLGVFLINNALEQEQALATFQTLTNYDGGAFQGILIEQYIPGTEYSVQGVVHNGRAHCLTICKKYIGTEEITGPYVLQGFRELGHIASCGKLASPALKRCVQTCVDTFGYQNGPFHADFVQSSQGFTFLEMGFRLSGGGLVRLVEHASGYNWAEEVFRLHLEETSEQQASALHSTVVGQFSVRFLAEIEAARRLQQQGYVVAIEQFSAPKVAPTASSLASDLLRHTGFLGRVIISTTTLEETQQLIERCFFQQVIADSVIPTYSGKKGERNG